jgi:hypothetical protein
MATAAQNILDRLNSEILRIKTFGQRLDARDAAARRADAQTEKLNRAIDRFAGVANRSLIQQFEKFSAERDREEARDRSQA